MARSLQAAVVPQAQEAQSSMLGAIAGVLFLGWLVMGVYTIDQQEWWFLRFGELLSVPTTESTNYRSRFERKRHTSS